MYNIYLVFLIYLDYYAYTVTYFQKKKKISNHLYS